MARFAYSPLDPRDNSIRLTRLKPAAAFWDEIKVDIFHTTFPENSPPDYEALSYVWGSAQNPETITAYHGRHSSVARWKNKLKRISSRGEKRESYLGNLSVTKNLAIALRHLRLRKKSRVMWIDAICINQEDINERNVQVSRMGTIYHEARQVVVWLGPGRPNSDLAISTLRDLGQDVLFDVEKYRLTTLPKTPTADLQKDSVAMVAKKLEWVAIAELLDSEWFKRLWYLFLSYNC